ncbi:recombinase family protein [Aeromonas hydrophila]|uniref:recombinase family protein n=1 Tax=Aeromonas hydrophila TaxID=644 RepID=UPI00208E564D|nr:recombinase family protein [Aeromonas hydrophila]MCO4201215.1 recombinase family protein [Aeromonas hydrophila]
MKPRAWLYARFSSQQQHGNDSLNRQQKSAESWCSTNGASLQPTSFRDLGVSGWKSIKRPMFEQLITAMTEGKIPSGSYVLFESTDRLSRRGWRHTQQLIRTITCVHDCKLVILDKGQVYTKENVNDVVQNILLMVSADMAEKESQRKSDLVAAAYKSKRQDGDVSRWPFWIDKTDDGFVLNDNAKTIRLIIELRLKGVGALGIAAELNRRGIKSARGGSWGHTSIRVVLSNSALFGTKDFYSMKTITQFDEHGEEIRVADNQLVQSMPDVFTPICDFTTWQQIQINGEKPGRKGKLSPFHNVLFCKCGAALGLQIGSAGERYRKCSRSKVGSCDQKMIRNFDETLVECLGRITYVSREIQKDEVPELQARLVKLEGVKDALMAAGALGALVDVYKDIAKAKDAIAAAQKVAVVPTTELKEVFTGSIDEQRIALKRLVEKVVVSRAENTASVKVHLTNGHFKVFGVNVGVKRKSGKNTIFTKSDTEKLAQSFIASKGELEPWEMEQE